MHDSVLAEYAGLQARLADPSVLRDFALARRLRRCLAALEPLREHAVRLKTLREDLADARELASADPTWAAEAERLAAETSDIEAELSGGLAWRDPYDPYDVILRVHAQADDEATTFVTALTRKYRRYCERRGWTCEAIDGHSADGPQWMVTMAVTAGEDGPGAWSRLKAENGLHTARLRAAGEDRLMTAAVRVTVLPDVHGEDVALDAADLTFHLVCTRRPGAPTSLLVGHEPTGVEAWGVAPHPHEAKERGLRTVRAFVAAAAIGIGEPAHQYVNRGAERVRHYDLLRERRD
ncbi:PCRF domain-containing protein [Spirillospora sp. CA-294931]|uniref:PCRF domain-containing protein n=1 Tax=Spirillospora sp. CA-294931 TaxID=3240042 RepID=UPI003D89C75E